MTREEELKGLESVCSFLGSMSDDERFEYLMKNSKSFKKEMEKMLKEFGLENVDRVGVEMTNGVIKIRKARDIPSGSAFRRVVNSYDICDYARFADPEEVEKATRK